MSLKSKFPETMADKKKVSRAFCLLIILLFFLPIVLFGQKIKFTSLKYNYCYITNSTGVDYIDTITFSATFKYKSIQDFDEKINFIQWDFIFLEDSISCFVSRLNIWVNKDSILLVPFKGIGACKLLKDKIEYKIFVGDLKQTDIFAVYFYVDYDIKHNFFHKKKLVYLGERNKKEIKRMFKSYNQTGLVYFR
jgi:hypothetical protein